MLARIGILNQCHNLASCVNLCYRSWEPKTAWAADERRSTDRTLVVGDICENRTPNLPTRPSPQPNHHLAVRGPLRTRLTDAPAYANIGMYRRMRNLTWFADCRSSVKPFPASVQDDIGHALYAVSRGSNN